jgi:hypothetical protein
MEQMGKFVMIIGVSLLALGALLWLGGKVPGIGKLPGDILIKRGNFTFYFPLATSILLSIILSIILALFRRK